MIVDTSAFVAIIVNEPDAARYRSALVAAVTISVSAVTALETRIVLPTRFGPPALLEFELALASGVEIVAFDRDMASLAFAAFERFGKGRSSGARLNFGDCASYALAKQRDEPLLFKGDDFARTDVRCALSAKG